MIGPARLLIFAACLVAFAPVHAQQDDIGAVLDHVIEAYGGETNLRKLDRMVQEWDFYAPMRQRHGSDIRRLQVPDQLKVELHYPDKTETRVLSGGRGYVRFDDGDPAIASDHQRDAMRLQLMRLYSPLALRERIDTLQMAAEAGYVALTLVEHGLRTDYLVNSENWRIEQVVGTLTIKGMEMQFRTEYSDFSFVDGVLIHQKENKFAGDVNTAKLRLRHVEFDAEFDPYEFTPHEPEDFEEIEERDSITAYRADAIHL